MEDLCERCAVILELLEFVPDLFEEDTAHSLIAKIQPTGVLAAAVNTWIMHGNVPGNGIVVAVAYGNHIVIETECVNGENMKDRG